MHPWWNAPGNVRTFDRIIEGLLDAHSVVAVRPAHEPDGFASHLTRAIDAEHHDVWSVFDITPSRDASTPNAVATDLARRLGVAGVTGDELTVDELVTNESMRGHLLLVRIEDRATWKTWSRFLSVWGRNQAIRDEHDPPVACVLVREDQLDGEPPVDVRLQLVRFTDEQSPLDVRFFLSLRGESVEAPRLAHRVWTEVTVALAGRDPTLAERLDTEGWLGPQQVMARLLEVATEYGWTDADADTDGPPAGATEVVEGRLRTHSAWVARLGDRREIERRIWRGQLVSLFPMIEDVRLELARKSRLLLPSLPLTSEYGEAREHLEELEFSDLLHYIPPHHTGPRSQARAARGIRNRLAHQRTVDLRELEEFERVHQQLVGAGNGPRARPTDGTRATE